MSDFDDLDEFIEYSIIFDEDATCPSCFANLDVSGESTISCPSCGAKINVKGK